MGGINGPHCTGAGALRSSDFPRPMRNLDVKEVETVEILVLELVVEEIAETQSWLQKRPEEQKRKNAATTSTTNVRKRVGKNPKVRRAAGEGLKKKTKESCFDGLGNGRSRGRRWYQFSRKPRQYHWR